jgi:plastocyanin
MAQIMGEEQNGDTAEQHAAQPAKDRTGLYLWIGVAGIVAVLGIAVMASNAFAHSGSGAATQSSTPSAGADASGAAGGNSDAQVVRITVTSRGYQPAQPTVQAGKPVRLIVDGSQAPGCYSYIISQSLGFSRELGATPEVIDLPALQPGRYGFSCGMGMIRGSLNVQ